MRAQWEGKTEEIEGKRLQLIDDVKEKDVKGARKRAGVEAVADNSGEPTAEHHDCQKLNS